MRLEFVVCETIAKARLLMPWAVRIVKVDGGYRGFESVDDYNMWSKQR